jgi:periplasmic protein TonB
MSNASAPLVRRLLLLLPALLAVTLLAAPQSLAAQDGPVFELSDVSSAPRLTSMERAAEQIRQAYPDQLRSRGVAGRVQLEAVVGSDGKVEAESVVVLFSEHAELGEAARRVASTFGFQPGQREGRAVRTRVVIPVVFQP